MADDANLDGNRRVVKLGAKSSFLLNDIHTNQATTVIRRYMDMNSQLGLFGSQVMIAMVIRCTQLNQDVPSNFMRKGLLIQAFNPEFRHNPTRINTSPILRSTMQEIGIDLDQTTNGHGIRTPDVDGFEGYNHMINYLARQYRGNTTAFIKKGWKPRINDSVKAHMRIHHPNATRDQRIVSREIININTNTNTTEL